MRVRCGARRRERKAERDLDCEDRWHDLDRDGVRLLDVDLDGVRRVDEDEDRWRDLDRDGVRRLDVDLDGVRSLRPARSMYHLRGRR